MVEILCAGFGGQGVLTTGLIVSDIALASGCYPTWIPSYGSEMRGGKANCVVKIDPNKVGTPALEEADIVLAMNIPSVAFSDQMRSGGTLIINSDIITDYRQYTKRTDLNVIEVPFDSIARSVNNPRGANVIAAGVIASLIPELSDYQLAEDAMLNYFAEKGKDRFAASNAQAFRKGYYYREESNS